MKGRWIQDAGVDAAIVFIHGILSDGEECWKHENGTFWPELIAEEAALSSVGVYLFKYKTGVFSATYSLGDAVDSLGEHLRLDNVLSRRQIIFVCHSMGGIVARRFLVKNAVELIDADKEFGLFLIASPSLGAKYANWLRPMARLLGHTQADILRFSQTNTWLNDLDRDFMKLRDSNRLKISGKELVEDQFIVARGIWHRQVVEPPSGARYFGNSTKIPNSDHSSIVRVEDGSTHQHRLLLEFVRELLSSNQSTVDTGIPSIQRHPDPTTQNLRFSDAVQADLVSCQLAVSNVWEGKKAFSIEWPDTTHMHIEILRQLAIDVEDHLNPKSIFHGLHEKTLSDFVSWSKSTLEWVDRVMPNVADRVVPLVGGMNQYWKGFDGVQADALKNYVTLCNVEIISRVIGMFRYDGLYNKYFPMEFEHWFAQESWQLYKTVFNIQDRIVRAKITEISGEEIYSNGLSGAYFWGPEQDVLASCRRRPGDAVVGTWFDRYLIPQNELRILESGSNETFTYDEWLKARKVRTLDGEELY